MSISDGVRNHDRRMRRVIRWALLVLGCLTVSFTALGIAGEHEPAEWTAVVFDSVGMLLLQRPGLEPLTGWPYYLYSAARLFAVLFVACTAFAIIIEVSRPARSSLRRVHFWWMEFARGREGVVIVGLGWIGGPLARALREGRVDAEGSRAPRPVSAIDLDEESLASQEAWRSGVLVVGGDATDPVVRAQAAVKRASEVFIVTGDDARNLEIAGGFLDDAHSGRRGNRRRGPLQIYVHVGDPILSAAVRSRQILPSSELVEFRIFSNGTLAAHDLFLDLCLDLELGLLSSRSSAEQTPARRGRVVPAADEVFHLFVLGFGLTGQSVALHTARFAHFANQRRPRLTVFGDPADGEETWEAFLCRHPAFAPSGMDLADPAFLEAGDGWDARPARPAAKAYRTADPITDDGLGAIRRYAIEYAVNAEFRVLEPELESDRVVDVIESRLRLQSPRPAAAIVVCFEEERRNFEIALRLQRLLMQRLPDDPTNGDGRIGRAANPTPSDLVVPIYVYLPVEAGLAALVGQRDATRDGESSDADRHYPLCVFGRQTDVTSYDAITRGRIRHHASALRGIHGVLSRQRDGHPDFEDSNVDAVLHAELKFAALGIRFHEVPAGGSVAPGQPLLDALFRPDVERAYRDFVRPALHPDGRPRLDPGELLSRLEAAAPEVRERISLMGDIRIPPPEERRRRIERRDDDEQWDALERVIQKYSRAAVERFVDELRAADRNPDVAGAMEHNRWMGERLARGWRFGPRSNRRSERPTFVPYERLGADERLYDIQQLARIVAAGRDPGTRERFVAVVPPTATPVGALTATPAA